MWDSHLSNPTASGTSGLCLEGTEGGTGGLDHNPGAPALPAGVRLRSRLDAATGAGVAALQVADADLRR